MFLDIFSSFDSNMLNSVMKTFFIWVIPLFMTFVPLMKIWMSSLNTILILVFEKVILEQVRSVKGTQLFSMKLMLFALFYMLLILNFAGLWPFVFSVSSHLWFSMSMGFSLWLGLLVSGWVKDPKSSAVHLYPSGAPMILGPLLILIETLSILIRPVSLSVRLVANMSTGHIVIALIGCFLSSLPSISSLIFTLIFSSFYFLFEMGICVIQAYIFFLLLGLYSDDH
uniref:ATP synthase subunit a n=1 Tax=Valvata piscinalis TaxID=699199 RepID=A0A7L7S639_9GAST|nr:ATP synthase F0 subunit 6 [Valvata piscinalis]